jgi:hypothetical protein
MSSEGAFTLIHLSETLKLRKRIEQQFATVARTTTHTTLMLFRESSNFRHGASSSDHLQGYNLDANTRGRTFPINLSRPPPLPSITQAAPRLQPLEPLRLVSEIFDSDLAHPSQSLRQQYSSSYCAPTGSTDFRAAAEIFRCWRCMFDADGSLSSFSAITQMNKSLALRITFHAASDDIIPDFGMIFNVTNADDTISRRKFFGIFNYCWFIPERFTLGMLNVFTQQLVQLVTALMASSVLVTNGCESDQRIHPQKRPALEK